MVGTNRECGWPLLFFFPLQDVAQYLPVVAQPASGQPRWEPYPPAGQLKETCPLAISCPVAVSAPLAATLSEQRPRGAQLSLSFLLTVVSC